jgi:cell division septal protein FtsQ
VKRRLAALALAVLLVAAIYWFFLRGPGEVTPTLAPAAATATIGSGADAVGVSAEGAVLGWLPPPKGTLPRLPLSTPPKGGRLAGPALEQARVLGAAPAALRRYLAGSYYGESGVDVELTSGIELRFGDDSQAAKKWKAAAAVLADPSITALDYVDLHAPGRPAYGGSGHSLPPAP